MDIVIYTNPEILLEKRKPDHIRYWRMSRFPKKFKERDRIYFAIKGEVKGYFICDEYSPGFDTDENIVWQSNSWVQLECIRDDYFCEPFRGFRYRWFEYEREKSGKSNV